MPVWMQISYSTVPPLWTAGKEQVLAAWGNKSKRKLPSAKTRRCVVPRSGSRQRQPSGVRQTGGGRGGRRRRRRKPLLSLLGSRSACHPVCWKGGGGGGERRWTETGSVGQRTRRGGCASGPPPTQARAGAWRVVLTYSGVWVCRNGGGGGGGGRALPRRGRETARKRGAEILLRYKVWRLASKDTCRPPFGRQTLGDPKSAPIVYNYGRSWL